MPKGVKKEKSVRLKEDLDSVLILLEKNNVTRKELEDKKKELIKAIENCKKDSLLNVLEESGLNEDELKKILEQYNKKSQEN